MGFVADKFHMDVTTYYITTLTNAAMKIGPIIAFIVVGYFIFFKLPFLFLLRNMGVAKKEFEQKKPEEFQKDYSIENYKDFQRRMKLMGPPKTESKKEEPKKEEKKKEEPKARTQSQEKKKYTPPPREREADVSAEKVFSIKTGEVLTKEELRKRYHDLLRQNHPDRVASMGAEFQKLAEKNTKDINKAYEKLKKAS